MWEKKLADLAKMRDIGINKLKDGLFKYITNPYF